MPAVPMRVLKKSLLLLSIYLAFFALVEIAARLVFDRVIYYDVEMTRYARVAKRDSADPRIGHTHHPNVHTRLMGSDVRLSSAGFRDREYEVERGDAYRIVFLGDSLTFGWGVESEEMFERLLEERFDRAAATEIVNLGTGNYNTEQETHFFLDVGLKYRPDRVVLFYFINDAEVTPLRSRWSVLGNSDAASFLWSRLRLATRSRSADGYVDYYRNLYRDDAPGWKTAKASLATLKRACDENDIRLQVVLLPELHQLAPYPFHREHELVMAYLREHDIDALDLAPLFEGEKNARRLWVAADDAHPNAEAHRRIADLSEEFIAGKIER